MMAVTMSQGKEQVGMLMGIVMHSVVRLERSMKLQPGRTFPTKIVSVQDEGDEDKDDARGDVMLIEIASRQYMIMDELGFTLPWTGLLPAGPAGAPAAAAAIEPEP